ncbi:DUF2452 domain-containing protein [Vibrio sp.]|uniref:DUF2452 domain-containing protein n=1 Tax=Vibrio sp. TaxID=678 RepID=UPI00311EC6E7
MPKDRPDNVPDSYSENAHILPYGSNNSAPAIVLPDTDLFKSERGANAGNYFTQKLDEINAEYQRLVDLANDTDIVYNSQYNFVPRVGQVYHLYNTGNSLVLSMIEPWKWNTYEFIGSFLFTADNTWERQGE